MIKPVERPSQDEGYDPLQLFTEWEMRKHRAVNMLIEEHNTLLQAMVDFNVMGTDAWQNIMLDEKDPNEPHHHPQEG